MLNTLPFLDYYATVVLYLINYAHVHLTLYTDVFPMIQISLNLFLTVVLITVIAIPVLARTGKNAMFCLHRYKCNVEKMFSGQMNNLIESHFIRSTDCMHVALANLLSEIITID